MLRAYTAPPLSQCGTIAEMKPLRKTVLVTLLLIGFIALLAWIVHGRAILLADPKGLIALKERDLILTTTLLMALIVVPVFLLTALIAWRYRAGNTSAVYRPDLEHDYVDEFIWWAVPCAIILVLAVITWRTSHELDTYRSLALGGKPMTIQAIALDWKWLFLYPDEHIATVNYIEFPVDTPVSFQITADAPMNSFWIPQLGGQMYAMPGMISQLHLVANTPGSYDGDSANFSGAGFSGMKFSAVAVSGADFASWVRSIQQSSSTLDEAAYDALVLPSENNAVVYYGSVQPNLFANIVSKFMSRGSSMQMDN